MKQVIAILALQGAFIEHKDRLERLGCTCVELRKADDLTMRFDRLVLPGGESTVQRKLLDELDMLEPLRQRIESGMPVLGTCAGLILLASRIDGGRECDAGSVAASCTEEPCVFGTLPVTVRRNAYGRQLGSFHAQGRVSEGKTIPMTFIRAPLITAVQPGVEVLATVGGSVVAVRYGHQIGASFHPELDEDDYLYELFLQER